MIINERDQNCNVLFSKEKISFSDFWQICYLGMKKDKWMFTEQTSHTKKNVITAFCTGVVVAEGWGAIMSIQYTYSIVARYANRNSQFQCECGLHPRGVNSPRPDQPLKIGLICPRVVS